MPARTVLIRHKIDNGDSRPTRKCRWRLPVHFVLVPDDKARDMLKKILRPSSSLWLFPIISVQESDVNLWPYVDYRRLNEVTRENSLPLSRADALYDAVFFYSGPCRWILKGRGEAVSSVRADIHYLPDRTNS